MRQVLAALDDSPAAASVLALARVFANTLGAEVDPVHICDGGARVVESIARSQGLTLRCQPGPLVRTLLNAGLAHDVIAVVIGARGTAGPRPLGSTALAVATSLPKPVLVVPPRARVITAIRRVLVPVEGVRTSTNVARIVAALAPSAELDIVALHISLDTDVPAFTDQPQHERPAWGREFLRRYCDLPPDAARLQTLVGRPEELIPLVAEQVDADLVALGWSQRLVPGRANVVRAVLERCQRPALLIPVSSYVAAGKSPLRN